MEAPYHLYLPSDRQPCQMELKRRISLCALGSAILAFGMYHIHSQCGITEGGALGLTLLAEYWLHISPAWSSLVINGICYLIGIRTLGWAFLMYSAISGGCFSLFYRIFECFPPLGGALAEIPLAAAVIGALFVGVGVGLCVRAGGAPTGDDALAMSLSRMTGISIEWMYLITDLTVLGLSLTYLPFRRIGYSLITVLLSGQIIGLIQKIGIKKSAA